MGKSGQIGWVVAVTLLVSCGGAAEQADRVALSQAVVPIPHPLTMLLRDAGVQRELTLDVERITAIAAALDEAERPLWRLRDLPPDKRAVPAERILDELKVMLAQTLSGRQRERLDQLVLQALGLRAVLEPDVVTRLQLSAGQVSRVQSTLDVLARELAALHRGGEATRDAERIRRRTLQGERDVLAILSQRQRTTLQALMGPAFDLSGVHQVACRAPELRDVETWINSSPLTLAQMRGRVVVVHFYAFGCINCVRNLPHYNAWFDTFSRDPLTIVGIHRPETAGERVVADVRRKAVEAGLKHPIAVDNQSQNWDAWANRIWPSVYLIDKRGFVRYWWYGELNWQGSEGEKWMRRKITDLLRE
jgi:peroxiredoxin